MAISNSAGGKGSGRRPSSIPNTEYGEKHEAIFGKKKTKEPMKPVSEASVELKQIGEPGDILFNDGEKSGWVKGPAVLEKEPEVEECNPFKFITDDSIPYPASPAIGTIYEYQPGQYKFYLKLGCQDPRWIDGTELTNWKDIAIVPMHKYVRLYCKEYEQGPGKEKNGIMMGFCTRKDKSGKHVFCDEFGIEVGWKFTHWSHLGLPPILDK